MIRKLKRLNKKRVIDLPEETLLWITEFVIHFDLLK